MRKNIIAVHDTIFLKKKKHAKKTQNFVKNVFDAKKERFVFLIIMSDFKNIENISTFV